VFLSSPGTEVTPLILLNEDGAWISWKHTEENDHGEEYERGHSGIRNHGSSLEALLIPGRLGLVCAVVRHKLGDIHPECSRPTKGSL
jgi:hypothetical protein